MADFLDDLLPIRRLLVDGQRQPELRDVDFDTSTLEIGTSDDGKVMTISALERRSRDTVTNNDSAFTTTAGSTWATREAKTQSGAGTPKAITVAAPADSTRSGHKHTARTIPGRVREYLINPDGSFISWLTMDGPVNMTWRADLGTGGRWVADRVYASRMVYRPEDYAVAGPVGIGNATYDDAAWNALRADLETLDPAQLTLLDSQGVVELFGRYQTNTGWVLRSHWGWSDFLVQGASAGIGQAPLQPSGLRYVGPTAVRGYNTTLAFNRTNRTIIRSAGSWVNDGVTVGMRIRVTTGSATNRRIHQPVQSITTTTNPNDTLVLEPPSENPVTIYNTEAVLPVTEGAVACDWIQWLAGFEFRGAHNSRIEDVSVWSRDDATNKGKLSCLIWSSIKQDTRYNETSSNNMYQRCSGYGVINALGAVCFAIGMTPGNPAIGSQCDSMRIRDCYFLGVPDYGAIATFTVSGNVLTTASAHGLVENEPVRVYAATTGSSLLPSALRFYTTYYARVLTATTLELSLTQGGSALALGSTGSGTRYLARPLQPAGIQSLDANNTKVNHIQDCKIVACGKGIDFELGSDGTVIRDCQFDTCDVVAIHATSAGTVISGCQGERLASAVWGPFGPAPVSVSSCSFNVASMDNRFDAFKGNLQLSGVHGQNTRSDFTITSVDAAANTVSFQAGSAVEAPTENQRVVLRNNLGNHRLPGRTAESEDYWLSGITVSGSTYTAQLGRVDGPSFPLDISSTGTGGTNYLASEMGHQAGDAPTYTILWDKCVFWGGWRLPRITQTNSVPLWTLSQSLTVAPSQLPRIRTRGCLSMVGGLPFTMADVEPDDVLCYPSFYTDISDMRLIQAGKRSCIEIDWRKLSTGFLGLSRLAFFPRRAGIKNVFCEVVPDDNGLYGFGGGSISAITVSVGYGAAANLMTAMDILAGSFADVEERRWGFLAAEMGTLLKGADGEKRTYWPKGPGTTDTGWVTLAQSLQVDFTIAGGTLANLNQGRLRLWFEFDFVSPGEFL